MARKCIKCGQVRLDCEFVNKAQARKGPSCFCNSCFQSAMKWEVSLRNFIDRRDIPLNRASDMYIKKAKIEKLKSEHQEKKRMWREANCSVVFPKRILKTFENAQSLRLERIKERNKQKVAELHDSYIASLLSNGAGVKPSQIPESLIEAKRVQLQIKRLIKERTK